MLADDSPTDTELAIRELAQKVNKLRRELAETRALLDQTTRNEMRLTYTLAYMQGKLKEKHENNDLPNE
jgi:hypothetical protein